MRSVILAMLSPPDSPQAVLLVRRANGQVALERVDARLAAAARVAAHWLRKTTDSVAVASVEAQPTD